MSGVAGGTSEARTGDQPFDCRVDGRVPVGDTAVVTFSNSCYDTWFTDHLSMVKVDGTWRMAARTYLAHPSG